MRSMVRSYRPNRHPIYAICTTLLLLFLAGCLPAFQDDTLTVRVTGPAGVEFEGLCTSQAGAGEDSTAVGSNIQGRTIDLEIPQVFSFSGYAMYCSIATLSSEQPIIAELVKGNQQVQTAISASPENPALLEYQPSNFLRALRRIFHR